MSPVAAIVLTAGVLLGGFGIADAATGGAFILGRGNSEAATSALSSSRGTPLSLSAPKGKAPLAVNRNVEVRNLNAEYVGGLSASAIRPSGGDDFAIPGSNIDLPPLADASVAVTGRLAAGTYYVTATAELALATGDPFGSCVVTLNNDLNHPLQMGAQSGGPKVTVAETLAVSVPRNGRLQEYCGISGSASGSVAINAGLTAIRILSSSGAAAKPS